MFAPVSRRYTASLITVVSVLSSSVYAQTPPPAAASTGSSDQEKLDRAVQAAADAAKSAAEAAAASVRIAQLLAASQPPKAENDMPPPPPPIPPKLSPWSGHIGANVLSVTGNANAMTGKISAKVNGEWPKWQLTLIGDAAYGQAQATGDAKPSVTALNADASIRGERVLGSLFSGYVQSGVLTDHVASIELQSFAEGGVGITWYEVKAVDYIKAKVKTDVGFRYTHESDYVYYPELSFIGVQNIYALRFAGSFRYAVSKVTVFSEDIEILPDIVVSKDLRVTSVTSISAQVAGGLAVSVGFKVRYIGVPAAGAKPTDTELGAGLSYTF